MYKKLIIGLLAICAGCSVYAIEKYNVTFKGFQNLERKQQLVVINNLQAIADNDDVEFSRLWPSEYFGNDGIASYVYMAKNDTDSFDIIKFDISKNVNLCGLAEKTGEFCIPKITPNLISYVYNERLIVDYTPNFIDFPKENLVFEVFSKDNKYVGNRIIRSSITPKHDNVVTNCSFDSESKAKICKSTDEDTNALLYTERLILKNPETPAVLDNILKYVKYNSVGNKVEEYIYSSGKHIFYNDKGEIIEFCQWNDNKFKYFNQKLPDLYIDMDIIRDANDRVVEEIYNDRNKKPVRRYTAEYEHGRIHKIHVYDIFNKADWEIEPIGEQSVTSPDFTIRY